MMNANPLALITGASRGIGAEYARTLATKGYNLFLVARDQARLSKLQQELEETGIKIWIACQDLAKPSAAQDVYERAGTLPQPVSLLINNAGFGWYGDFSDMPVAQMQEMLDLHITTTTHCSRLFVHDMVKRKQGIIINVASIAGLTPIPYMATYAATKAYIIAFSEALAREVENQGVQVQVCCPGFTQTDFHETAGHRPRHVLAAQSTHEVVQVSLRALQTSQVRVTIGWPGRLAQWVTHWFPRRWLIPLIAKFIRKDLT